MSNLVNNVLSPFFIPPSYVDTSKIDGGAASGMMPLLVYNDDWDENDEDFKKKVVQQLHNVLHLRYLGFQFGSRGLNPLDNYNAYLGMLDSEDYLENTHTYGEEGNAPLKDYSFFDTNVNILVGMIMNQPFDIDVKTVNSEAGEGRLEAAAEMATESFMRSMSESLRQEGMDLEPAMVDKSVYVPTEEEERMAFLTEKDQIEQAVTDMLHYTKFRYHIETELSECFRDKAIVDQEYCEIYQIGDSDCSIRRIHPKQISWIGDDFTDDIGETDAQAITRYIHLNTAIQKYGQFLDVTGRESLIKQLRDLGSEVGTTWYGNFQGFEKSWLNGHGHVNLSNLNGWMGLYYPTDNNTTLLCEQRMFFKMIRLIRFKIEYKGRAATKEEFADYKKGKIPADDIVYVRIEKDYKEKAGEVIVKRPIVELWQSTRLGANLIVDLKRCPVMFRDRNDPANTKPPIIGYVGKGRSLVTKGKPLQQMYNGIIRVIRKQVNTLGITALAYDLSQMPNGYDVERVLYEGKEVGLYLYNSKQVVGGPPSREDGRHLTKVDMGNTADILNLLNLAALIHEAYDRMCGITASMKGQLQDRQGVRVTEAALAQGNLVLMPMFREHRNFVAKALQMLANYGKHVWANKPTRNIILGKAGRKILQLTKKMASEEYGIFFMDGYQAQQDKQVISSLADKALSSGTATLGEVLDIIFEDNPQRAKSVFKQGMSVLNRMQAEGQQAQSQAMQAKAQADQIKAQSPIEVANINRQTQIEVTQMKIDAEKELAGRKIEFEEDKADIDNSVALQQESFLQNRPTQ
jgi:hypothetical protein